MICFGFSFHSEQRNDIIEFFQPIVKCTGTSRYTYIQPIITFNTQMKTTLSFMIDKIVDAGKHLACLYSGKLVHVSSSMGLLDIHGNHKESEALKPRLASSCCRSLSQFL